MFRPTGILPNLINPIILGILIAGGWLGILVPYLFIRLWWLYFTQKSS